MKARSLLLTLIFAFGVGTCFGMEPKFAMNQRPLDLKDLSYNQLIECVEELWEHNKELLRENLRLNDLLNIERRKNKCYENETERLRYIKSFKPKQKDKKKDDK